MSNIFFLKKVKNLQFCYKKTIVCAYLSIVENQKGHLCLQGHYNLFGLPYIYYIQERLCGP